MDISDYWNYFAEIRRRKHRQLIERRSQEVFHASVISSRTPAPREAHADRASARALFALVHSARWLWRIFTHRGSSSKTTLTVLESVGWVHPPEMDLAKKFEAQTGIHIEYQIIPAANYFQVLNTKLNSGQGPDIFGGQSGVSDLKVNYNVEANAVDLSNEEWVKREDPNAACPGDRRRQGVWPGDLGHLQRLLGHRLQQDHLPAGGDHQRPGDVRRFRGR